MCASECVCGCVQIKDEGRQGTAGQYSAAVAEMSEAGEWMSCVELLTEAKLLGLSLEQEALESAAVVLSGQEGAICSLYPTAWLLALTKTPGITRGDPLPSAPVFPPASQPGRQGGGIANSALKGRGFSVPEDSLFGHEVSCRQARL